MQKKFYQYVQKSYSNNSTSYITKSKISAILEDHQICPVQYTFYIKNLTKSMGLLHVKTLSYCVLCLEASLEPKCNHIWKWIITRFKQHAETVETSQQIKSVVAYK